MAGFTVCKYLATRLEQIGLRHYFMVPGDYNLVLLDELLTNTSLEQIGCCNELNAAYAAEGYARVNGCGAVITTFNVGAFSALNGVAGAYAERLPVIFVSSGPNTNDAGANHILHHTLGTHDFSYQYEVIRRVTCAAVRILHPENAPAMIDEAIGAALRERDGQSDLGARRTSYQGIIGAAPSMLELYSLLDRVAPPVKCVASSLGQRINRSRGAHPATLVPAAPYRLVMIRRRGRPDAARR